MKEELPIPCQQLLEELPTQLQELIIIVDEKCCNDDFIPLTTLAAIFHDVRFKEGMSKESKKHYYNAFLTCIEIIKYYES